MPYLARTENKGLTSDWEVLKSETETAAKRVISRKYAGKCLFLHLAYWDDKTEKIKLIARKHSLQKDWTNF